MKYGTDDPNFGMVGEDFHCASCKFLEGDDKCSNKDFQKFNGSSDLPAAADKYCCNAFRKAVKPSAQLIWISSKPLNLA